MSPGVSGGIGGVSPHLYPYYLPNRAAYYFLGSFKIPRSEIIGL